MTTTKAPPWRWMAGRACAALAVACAAIACAPGTPRIDGGPGAPVSPATPWPVPAAARTPAPRADSALDATAATRALGADATTLADARALALVDVVDIALRNNPATRESWANARAGAEAYGAARGALFPSLDGSVSLSRSANATLGGAAGSGNAGTGADSTGGRANGGFTGTRTTLTPQLTLSYLVLDFGGRAGTIRAARERAIAADLAHNATVQDVVLQVESALFSFLATRALREAQDVAVREAEADLAAAEERHRVGVATIQDVLQARTARSQAQLQAAGLESDLQGARAALATAMGIPANARFDVPEIAAADTVPALVANVDSLVAAALAARPEVAGARAEARALAAQVRVARAAGFPALTLRSSAGYVEASPSTTTGRTSSIALGLQIPVFDGFARQYRTRQARAEYEAGLARAAATAQQVRLQVWTAYYALQAAGERVRISTALLADATQSASVAYGRYRGGVGTLTDVLLARSALATARAEAIQARWEWRTALVQLAHDAGALDTGGRPRLTLQAR